MEIIMTKDIPALGYYKNDFITVKDGYGRNYLIPQGFAVVANAGNKKIAEENKRQAVGKVEKRKEIAQRKADRLNKMNLLIYTKTAENGKIFGSITPLQILKALREENKDIDIESRQIKINCPIKEVGTYQASIALYKGIEAQVSFEVQSVR